MVTLNEIEDIMKKINRECDSIYTSRLERCMVEFDGDGTTLWILIRHRDNSTWKASIEIEEPTPQWVERKFRELLRLPVEPQPIKEMDRHTLDIVSKFAETEREHSISNDGIESDFGFGYRCAMSKVSNFADREIRRLDGER